MHILNQATESTSKLLQCHLVDLRQPNGTSPGDRDATTARMEEQQIQHDGRDGAHRDTGAERNLQ
ncbi:Uncharacterised protein [Mycobacteroides abscessus subsp. massiliense]|nr:Uncharacterised protein [Mycobacteroides abscessus subsp. massiliense]